MNKLNFILFFLLSIYSISHSNEMMFQEEEITFNKNIATLPSWGNGAPCLNIELIPNYQIKYQIAGVDFDVYKIYNKENPNSSMGLYIGHNPQEIDTSGAIYINSIIDEKEVICSRTQKLYNNKTIYYQQVYLVNMFNKDSDFSNLKIHFFIVCDNLEDIINFQEIAETLKN